MKSRDDRQRLVLQALALGLAGGMRSWPPLAMFAATYDAAPTGSGWRRWPILRNPWGRRALIALGVGETVADKWPGTISRLQVKPQLTHIDGGLLGRVGLDAVAGAALGSEYSSRNSTIVGAAVGGLAALLGNVAGNRVRQAVVASTKLPDPTVGMIEDVACFALLTAVTRSRGVRLARPKA